MFPEPSRMSSRRMRSSVEPVSVMSLVGTIRSARIALEHRSVGAPPPSRREPRSQDTVPP